MTSGAGAATAGGASLKAENHQKSEAMPAKAINLLDKFKHINELWSPRVVAGLNDYQVKLARIDGEFVWHDHPDTDELFLCLEGELTIHMHDGDVLLGPGELFVVPKGVQHKPVTRGQCKILLLEPRGVVNTGGIQNELTAATDQWV